jgi:hypothetical protein
MMLYSRQIKRMIKAQRGTICHFFTLTLTWPIMVARSTLRFFISTAPDHCANELGAAEALEEFLQPPWQPLVEVLSFVAPELR